MSTAGASKPQIGSMLTRNWGKAGSHRLETYKSGGGYTALEKALKMAPDAITDEVKKANLRGRGGAGFPTGMKWGFVPKDTGKPKYLLINADESEPGTFKDRYIMELDPHMLIEGMIIAAFALGVRTAYIYVRGEFMFAYERCLEALAEAYKAGYLGKNILGSGYDLDVYMHRGAGAYICGEETALIESLEGKKGQPRLKPPFPAVQGVFACPTIVNNVETIANVPFIIGMGWEAYAKLGTARSGGLKLYCVSGPVKKPGVYELPLQTTLRELLFDHCGGIRDGRQLKAVIPGGSSVPVLAANEIDVMMEFDALREVGTFLGSAGVIVMDDQTCMVRALLKLMHFYAHESCGQCTPCREGTGWLAKVLHRLEEGHGTQRDIDLLASVSKNMMGTTICPLADAAAMPTQSFLKKFMPDFVKHVEQHKCPYPAWTVRPSKAAPGPS